MNAETWSISLIFASALFVALILGALIHVFDLHEYVHGLLTWIDQYGAIAPLILIVVHTLIVIFLMPGILVTMGAGFLFGVAMGSLYIVIATTLGAVLAFLASRYLFSKRAIQYINSYPRLKLVDHMLAKDGWRIVLLTRLIPFFPFKLSNYLFGLTKFRLRDFFIGTFVGIWPLTIFNVYVGSLLADLSMLGTDTSREHWEFYLGGFLVSIIAIVYIFHRARVALAGYAELSD